MGFGSNSSNKSEAPKYPETTMSSNGLFGSSINNSSGYTYNPSDFETKLVNFSKDNALNSLQEYLNPNYDSEAFHQADDYYANKIYNNLQNNYLNGALQQGLLRGSTAGDVMRGFANDMANTEYERQKDYKNQQLQNYQAAMLPYATAYDVYAGNTGLANSLANSIANYGLSAYTAQNAANRSSNGSGLGSLIGGIGGLGTSLLSSYLGNGSSSSSAPLGTIGNAADNYILNGNGNDYGTIGSAINDYVYDGGQLNWF